MYLGIMPRTFLLHGFPLLRYLPSSYCSTPTLTPFLLHPSLSLSSSPFSTFVTHTNPSTNTIRPQLLDSIRTVTTLQDALDMFHKMVAVEPLPPVKDFNLLFSIVAKKKHYTTSISLIKHMYSLGFKPHMYTLSIVINCLCRLNHTVFGFSVLGLMFKIGVEPSRVTLNTLVNGLCMEGNVAQAIRLVDHLENLGYESNRYTHGAIINGLCKVGDTFSAISYLQKIEETNCNFNVAAYSAIMDSLCKDGKVSEALDVFSQMIDKGIQPNLITYNSLIHGLCNFDSWKDAATLLCNMMRKGIMPDVQTFNILVDNYSKARMISRAKRIVSYMGSIGVEPNVVTYNSMINAHCLRNQMKDAMEVFDLMIRKGCVPDVVTYSSLIHGWCKIKNMNMAMYLLGEMINNGLHPEVVTWSTLIGGFCKTGRPLDAKKLFFMMHEHDQLPNIQTCAIILDGLFKCHFHSEAMSLFKEFEKMTLDLDAVIYNIILEGMCSLGKLNDARELFSSLASKGVVANVVMYTTMIKNLCKEGLLDEAEDLLKQMEENGCHPTERTYNVFVGGLLRRYDISRATKYLQLMLISDVLGELISEEQSAFVQGRSMKHNVLLVQELLKGYNRKRVSPRCMIKLDLVKAYDALSWEFLDWVMKAVGFPPAFINWVLTCVTTTSYSVLVNGSPSGMFKGERGIRQGDPISPYLFVLCMEYLSRDLNRLKDNMLFQFHPTCGALKINHLAFADDVVLFCRGDLPSVGAILTKLNHFSAVSGLEINYEKSEMVMAGVSQAEQEAMIQLSGFSVGHLPFHYLGYPVHSSSIKAVHFAPFINKAVGLIGGWRSKSLSYAGRLELVRSVLQGIANFWMQVVPLPCSVLTKITSLCRCFLWGKPGELNFKPLVAWDVVCGPKECGGLNLFNLKIWNKALIVGALWDIHSDQNSLWVRWIHGRYLRHQSIWTVAPKQGDSMWFKVACRLRDHLREGFGTVEECCQTLTSWCVDDKLKPKFAYDWLSKKGDVMPGSHLVWKASNPPKMAFVWWLAAKGKLLTKDRAPFLPGGANCNFCDDHIETHRHLFFECRMTKLVWTSIRSWIQFPAFTTSLGASMDKLIRKRKASGRTGKIMCLALAVLVYHVWSSRNRSIFEGKPLVIEELIARTKYVIMKYAVLQKLI